MMQKYKIITSLTTHTTTNAIEYLIFMQYFDYFYDFGKIKGYLQ